MAYGLVVSLKQIVEPLLGSGRSRIQIPNSEVKLIYDDLCYLKSFFDKMNSLEDSNSVEELEIEIKDVLQKIQDLIESHISDLYLVHSGSESSISGFSRALVEFNENLGSLITRFKAKENNLTGNQQSPGRSAAGVADSSRVDFGRYNKMVGLEDELLLLKQRLFRGYSRVQVISIVGMAGIGKTCLAKMVCFDQQIKEHFDICLFVEIGLEYQVKELLLRLLVQLGFDIEKTIGKKDRELGDCLFINLFGRRYLVVLDGMWDTLAWSELKWLFPDNKTGSRIIWTTRLTNVARGACKVENILQKRFLNDDGSWELLRDIAFSDMEAFPLELEETGKKIVKSLGGLPLAIVEIGKLLSILPKTVESWTAVAQNINSVIQETTIPNILHLSYAQLPQHLKPCFFSLGVLQPSYNIPTSQLIKSWVAEGFIEPAADKSLEQKAEEYLEDLVSRSLVIVVESSSSGGIKTCRIHELLQDLCVSEARLQKIFQIVNEGTANTTQGTRNQRRLGVDSNVVLGFKQVRSLMKSVRAARSLLCVGPQHQHPLRVYLGFRWPMVLNALSIRYCKFPDEVLRLVRLRYLAITCDGELPPSISSLWNLQVLIIHRSRSIKSSVFLPLEIWKLDKLRHLHCIGFDLPDPCGAATGSGDFLSLGKLLTLSGVSALSCIEKDLINKNLVMVGKRNARGEVKTCRIHDAIHAFCSSKEMKLSNGAFDPPTSEIDQYRRLCIHSDLENFLAQAYRKKATHIRSLLCFNKIPSKLPLKYAPTMVDGFDLLRVMESESIKLDQIPRGVTKLFHLRYITLSVDTLETLAEAEDVFSRAPHLKRLGIQGNLLGLFNTNSLGMLNQVEKLKQVYTSHDSKSKGSMRFPELRSWFPPKLKMLTITAANLDWMLMSMLAKMETLQVLKLQSDAFSGLCWEAVGGGFLNLHFLLIEETDIFHWKVSNVKFPVLRECKGMAEKLDIEHLGKSAVESARRIEEEKGANQGQQRAAARFKLTIGTGCE